MTDVSARAASRAIRSSGMRWLLLLSTLGVVTMLAKPSVLLIAPMLLLALACARAEACYLQSAASPPTAASASLRPGHASPSQRIAR